MKRIGLVSDTHGLLRPEVLDFLRGSDHIIHAGDICEAWVLEQLRELAPLTAVRGNNDVGPWARALQEEETLEVEGVRIRVIHDLAELDRGALAGVHAVISGHSHRPKVEEREGTLWVNPGSAGPRRFKLPISAGELLVDGGKVSAKLATF